MPQTLPDKVRSVEYLNYLAESRPGKYDQDIAACCAWAANRIKHIEDTLQDVIDAIKTEGMDLMPCRNCGSIVLTVPEGLCLCKVCEKREEREES